MKPDPDLETLYQVIDMCRLTPETLAEEAGVDLATVRRTLEGKTRPRLATRILFADALEVPLALLTHVVWPQADSSGEERQVHRRRLLQLAAGTSVAAAASLLLPGIDPLEVSARVSRLVARFAATDPLVMFKEATRMLDTVIETLDARLSQDERDRLLADAVDAASVAAWSATLGHRRADAAAYFALAREYADRSEDPFLKGAALASSARLDRPFAGNRPSLARRKLRVAIPLLGNSVYAKWATWLEAEAYAALNRPRECLGALERAHGMVPFDSGERFFSSAGQVRDWKADGAHDQWGGQCYANLGQADNAVMHMNRALTGERRELTMPPAASSGAALAYTIAGEPEAACAHAVRALDGARETGYRAGVARVRHVRGRMREEWLPLACVKELDERLRLAS